MKYLNRADEDKFLEFVEQTGDEEKGYELLMRWKCLTDLYYLGSVVLGMGEAKRMGDPLLDPKFHGWMCDILGKDEHALYLLPRGHLKTAWLCVYAVQCLLRNPNERIHIYSITQEFVENTHLVTIKQHMETPLLNRLFPDVVPPREEWEKDVKNMLTMRRQPTQGEIVMGEQIQVYGVGNTITGRRATIQLFDDLIDKDTVRTQTQQNKTREWFSGAMPVLEPGGMRKMIGTPYHYNDLYHVIDEDEIFDKVYQRPIKVNGKFACKWWTEKKLKHVTRGMLPYDIKSQYYLDPMPIEDMAFPPPQPTYKELPNEEFTWYIACDPAATTEKYSDETAIIVAAVTGKGEVYITDEYHGRWPGNETAKKLIGLAARIEPRKVGIEFGLQEHLKYIIDTAKSDWEAINKRTLPIYIEPIKVTNRKSKFDRVNWTLGAFVKEGRVHIHESCIDLMAQMDRFNKNYNGKDDLVDAAAMIFQIADNFSYRTYTKEVPEWVAKDYFVVADMEPVKSNQWDRRFIS